MSLSDGTPMMTMPVAPANTNNGGFGWGGDGAWWIVLFLIFAAFGGWGNGFGFGGGNGGGVMDGYVLTSDFASVERKLDSISNGICDSTFALNNAITGGFATTTQALNSGFQTAELSRANQQAALMQQLNAMQMQAQQCCCDQRADTAQLRYDLAAQGCETRNAIQTSTREIVTNANDNTRAILDFLVNSKMQDLQTENQNLKLAASQAAQTSDIRNYVSGQFAYYNPRPVPSFAVPAPYQFSGCNGQYACGGC